MKKKFITLTIAMLALFGVAAKSEARTIIVRVNPSTWAIVEIFKETDGVDFLSWWNFQDKQVSRQDQYGNWSYRYYTGGFFDHVVIERSDNGAVLAAFDANNLFYIDRSVPSGYVCATGYNGSGNGTSGEIKTAAALSNGDLVIGGLFSVAGGYGNTTYFSCYRWTEGWSGVNNIFASEAITQPFSFNGSYQLIIQFNHGGQYVYGPLSSGGSSGYKYVNGNSQVFGNTYYQSFPNFWFSN
jgi:hypothetical protein